MRNPFEVADYLGKIAAAPLGKGAPVPPQPPASLHWNNGVHDLFMCAMKIWESNNLTPKKAQPQQRRFMQRQFFNRATSRVITKG